MRDLVEQLAYNRRLDNASLKALLNGCVTDEHLLQLLRDYAVRTAREQFGLGVYIRGLIELSSYCKCDCLYCGLRRSNRQAERYRLSHDEVMMCCKEGYNLGFRTFVLQGGEDGTHTDEWLVELLQKMRTTYPDVAITLSLGERSEESYRRLKEAGANRYLLRHEAADADLYAGLHPSSKGLEHRLECLGALKRLAGATKFGFNRFFSCPFF